MIDPSLRVVLRSRYTILRFFALFGLLLGAFLLLLFVITAYAPAGSPFRESATNFLGNFAATVAVFIAIYLFYVLITPPGLRDAEVVPLRDVEIGDGIINLPANASDYWFWGRSGSYFRSAVLPRLDDLAPVRVRIGIGTGPALVGNIGAPSRMNYTLVGDAVNIAQRLEQVGKDVQDDSDVVTLITEGVYTGMAEPGQAVFWARREVREREGTMGIYRLT